jgi:hypothetical protein
MDRAAMTASAESPKTPGSTVGTARNSGGLWEWFWRANALRAAKTRAPLSSRARERLRRARLALELADRAIDPADPLQAGSSLPLALSLYREAAYWSLVTQDQFANAADVRQAFAASKRPLPTTDLTEQELAVARAALCDKTFVQTAEDDLELVRREAELCQTLVHGLIREVDVDQASEVSNVFLQRWLRSGFLLLALLAAAVGAKVGSDRVLRGPDLALGKPWRASSQAYPCHPLNMECGGTRTTIFFHTNEEYSPWVELDLGTAQTVGRVEVTNRDDCCAERAVPLVVEVSVDQKRWREVIRRVEPFQTWTGSFKPESARYVRLRVTRRSVLHLSRVIIRAK